MRKEDLSPAAQDLIQHYMLQLVNAGLSATELGLNHEFLVPDRPGLTEDEVIEYVNQAWSLAKDRAIRMGANIK
jgi:hypothetical protein